MEGTPFKWIPQIFKKWDQEYQYEDTQARLDSSDDEWVDDELQDVKSQLVQERSFRKVYTAVGILAFLYGLFYGVYLSK